MSFVKTSITIPKILKNNLVEFYSDHRMHYILNNIRFRKNINNCMDDCCHLVTRNLVQIKTFSLKQHKFQGNNDVLLFTHPPSKSIITHALT